MTNNRDTCACGDVLGHPRRSAIRPDMANPMITCKPHSIDTRRYGYDRQLPIHCTGCGESIGVWAWESCQLDGQMHTGEVDGGLCLDLRTHHCGSTVGREFCCKKHTQMAVTEIKAEESTP